MVTKNRTRKVIILGMGNLLLKDEGIGVHIAQALQEAPSPANVEMEVIDGGTLPDVFPLDGVDKLVVVDAVKGGSEPGAIYRFRPKDIRLENGIPTSLHQINLLENLWLMERFSHKPDDVVIIGIEPENMDWGLELSATLQKQIPRITQVVMEEVRTESPDKPEKGE